MLLRAPHKRLSLLLLASASLLRRFVISLTLCVIVLRLTMSEETVFWTEQLQNGQEPEQVSEQAPEPKKRGRQKRQTESPQPSTKSHRNVGTGSSAKARQLQTISDGVQSTLALAGMLVSAFDAYDGEIILTRSPQVAEALTRLADQNAQVRQALSAFFRVSVYGELAAVLATIAVPIAANHGVLPREAAMLVGAPVPEPRGD